MSPGCPETYREDESSFQGRLRDRLETRGEEEGEEKENSSQKVRRVRRRDVIAIFAGVAYRCYNDGNEPLQIVAIADVSNPQNQGRMSYQVNIPLNLLIIILIPLLGSNHYCIVRTTNRVEETFGTAEVRTPTSRPELL